MSAPRQTTAARMAQVVQVLARHGFGGFLDRMHLEGVPGLGRVVEYFRGKPSGLAFADRFRLACEELGPTFVKLGQLMASRPDLVSPEVAGSLAGLRDSVPPFPGETALEIVRRAVPGGLESFASIEPEAAAAASIAQVHFAVLRDGTPVAVKVRRPGIAEAIETDVGILFVLARLAERHIPEASVYRPTEVAREFARTIRRELDFTLEAGSVERFARQFADDPRVVVPRVFPEATSPEVLTVERLVGGVVPDGPAALVAIGVDPRETARAMVEVFLAQVLEHGFFHGDPHGGNVLVLPGGRIGFMDFGIVGVLDDRLRRSLMRVFLALVDFDTDRLAAEYLRLEGSDRADPQALARDLRDLIQPWYGLPLGRLPVGQVLMQSLQITLRHGVAIPPDLLLLGKALLTLEGTVRRLDPELNLVELARPWAARLLRRRWAPRQVARRLLSAAEDYGETVALLPGQIGELLARLIRGRLRIDLHHENLESLMREMDRSANRVSFSLVISAIIIGSSLIITTDRGFKVLGYPALGVAGFLFAGLLGIALVIAILRSGRL